MSEQHLAQQKDNDSTGATMCQQTLDSSEPLMSKNQQKKRARLQKFLAVRKERRMAERTRRKERRKAAKEIGQRMPTKAKLYTMNESKCRIRVAIDMAYDELMDKKTVRKTVRQLNHCYASNRRVPNPLQFFITNLSGKAREVFNEQPDYNCWDAHIMFDALIDLWRTEEIVYLTADSDNVLIELDEEKVYVIGGLLDHNHRKGLCLQRAQQNGFAHAKLPIDNFVRLSTRKVLAINHVFDILLHYTRERNWEKAFMAVIPKRKGVEQHKDAATKKQDKRHVTLGDLDLNNGKSNSGIDKIIELGSSSNSIAVIGMADDTGRNGALEE